MPSVITSGPVTVYMSTVSSSSSTWQAWNTAGTTTLTWDAWNQVYWTSLGTTTDSSLQWNYAEARPAMPVAETAEQRARREEDQERRRQELERAQERSRELAEAARQNAEQLLTALLTDEQNTTWREHSYFTVLGSSSGRTYRIRRGIAGNVDLMAEYEDAAEVTYCAHPPGIPAEDVCLAQLFLLCTDEDAFLAVANVHRRHVVRQRPELRAVA